MGRSAQLFGRPDLSDFRRIEMHDNPRATDEEQELAQTERMDDEEQQRSYAPTEATDDDEDESED
jgi:hypothetical protein